MCGGRSGTNCLEDIGLGRGIEVRKCEGYLTKAELPASFEEMLDVAAGNGDADEHAKKGAQ